MEKGMKEHNLKLVRTYWEDIPEDTQLNNELDSILSSCSTRSERLAKIAELCLPAETNEELYYISKCYVWAGAKYRLKAIEYLKKYIDAGAIWEGTPDGMIKMQGYIIDQKKANIASAYTDLGNCLEGEYKFDEAIKCYKKAYSLTPYFPANLIKISQVFVKKNDLPKALDVLLSSKESPYCQLNEFRECIARYQSDVENKIKKGYVYKPRKQKQ